MYTREHREKQSRDMVFHVKIRSSWIVMVVSSENSGQKKFDVSAESRDV